MASTKGNDYNIELSEYSMILEDMSPQAQELIKSIKWPIRYQYETFGHDSVFQCPIWMLTLHVIIDDKNETLNYYCFDVEPYEEYFKEYSEVFIQRYETLHPQARKIVDQLRPTGEITFHFERYGWGDCDSDGPLEHFWTLYIFVKTDPNSPVTKHKYYREVFELLGDKEEEIEYKEDTYNDQDEAFLKPILRKVC